MRATAGGKAADQYPAFNEHRRREGNDEQPDSQHRPDVGQQQRQHNHAAAGQDYLAPWLTLAEPVRAAA